MFKLGIYTNSILTSIDYYRTMGFWPFFTDTELMKEVNWWTVPAYDAVLVSRPVTLDGYRACQIVKELGKRLILDYDDNMFSLPDEFDADRKSMSEYTLKCLGLADLVICSTDAVARAYSGFPTVVRRNLFNDWIFKFEPVFSTSGTYGFRGTERVHKWNVNYFDKIFREGDWIFWGGWMDQYYGRHLKEIPFIDYMVSIRDRSPSIIVKPLVDTPHNRCKSNCTWLEATYAGAVCVAPDWPEWNEDGIVNYKDIDDCMVKMKELQDTEYRRSMFDKSVKTIREKFLIINVTFNPEEYGL
jgi:hypothetical protein